MILEEEPADTTRGNQQQHPHPPIQMRRESAPVAPLSAAEPRVQRFRRSFSRASRVSSTDILPEPIPISRRSSEARDLIAKSRTSPVKQLDATLEKGVKWKRMMTPFFGTTLRKMMAGQETAERQTRLDEIRKTLDARYDALVSVTCAYLSVHTSIRVYMFSLCLQLKSELTCHRSALEFKH